MLVFQIKENGCIRIGEEITIEIPKVGSQKIVIGVAAPIEVKVRRAEALDIQPCSPKILPIDGE